VLKTRGFVNVFISFFNFFQASRFGGGVDHLGNTWENPYIRGLDHLILDFGFWTILDFGKK
jgi:hypothetical protein